MYCKRELWDRADSNVRGVVQAKSQTQMANGSLHVYVIDALKAVILDVGAKQPADDETRSYT